MSLSVKLCGNCVQYGEEVEVSCENGTVRGATVKTCYGPEFVRFAGIPYAKPPIGPLRFLPPVPLQRWENTVDATRPKDGSWAHHAIHDFIEGSEDCLHITIHVPVIRPDKLMPVMVWIGGWTFGYDDYKIVSPGWFSEESIIIVNISFRLGPFGFLSIGEASAPGNCGLKDVTVALRLIQRNILAFGGNPENVTLFGSGSGGSIVHYMMLSPMAKGLFHKAIVQSGCALHQWAFSYDPLDPAKKLAKELNIETTDMNEAVEHLRTLPAQVIMRAFGDIIMRQNKKHMFFTLFKPCAELQFEGQPTFLTNYPYYLLKSGKINRVPLMIGSNRHEGKGLLYYLRRSSKDMLEHWNANFSVMVPQELGLDNVSKKIKDLEHKLLQFYMQGQKLTEENSEEFFKFLTDYYFVYDINRCVKRHSEHNPTFYYISDAAMQCFAPKYHYIEKESASFGSEVVVLFQYYGCIKYSSRSSYSTIIRQKMIKLWTNFAKYGNPTPKKNDELLQVIWEPVTNPERVNYLRISSDLTTGCNVFHERMSFWDAIFEENKLRRAEGFYFMTPPDTEDKRVNWYNK